MRHTCFQIKYIFSDYTILFINSQNNQSLKKIVPKARTYTIILDDTKRVETHLS